MGKTNEKKEETDIDLKEIDINSEEIDIEFDETNIDTTKIDLELEELENDLIKNYTGENCAKNSNIDCNAEKIHTIDECKEINNEVISQKFDAETEKEQNELEEIDKKTEKSLENNDNNGPKSTSVPISYRLGSAALYFVVSIAIQFEGKIILTNYGFPCPMIIGLGQMITTILLLRIGKFFNFISFPDLDKETYIKIFPFPFFYVVNLYSGLTGTKHLSLPMFSVLRRFTILLTMILEYFIFGVKPTLSVILAVTLMLTGVFVAATFDLSFDCLGYIMILIYNCATAGQGISAKHKLKTENFGKEGLLFYSALFMLAPSTVAVYVKGDFTETLNFETWSDPLFTVRFVAYCFLSSLFAYAIILCIHYNSALTQVSISYLKSTLTTYAGMLVSVDYVFSLHNFIGINISTIGGLLYGFLAFRSKQARKESDLKEDIPKKKPNLNNGILLIIKEQMN